MAISDKFAKLLMDTLKNLISVPIKPNVKLVIKFYLLMIFLMIVRN